MKEMIVMTQEGQKRVKLMELLKAKKIKQHEAAELLQITTRQVKRIFRDYKLYGDKAMNHGHIGKPSNNATDPEEKQKILKVVQEKFAGYKPGFIAEKLAENFQIDINSNTLRLWMIEIGLWQKTKKSPQHRNRRTRKAHFGEMVQMDGSPHDWFETGQEYCLMNMIDDSNNIEFGLFDTGETSWIALKCLYQWIEKYGIPLSIYTDHGGVYYQDKEPSVEEQLKGTKPKTRFGLVCEDLGIEIIYANSPQAKGRVERANGVQQDRLIAELRYNNIKDIKSANEFLQEKYWDQHNTKYAIKSASSVDLHIPLLEGQDLRNIICFRDARIVGPDYVVRLGNRLFQLVKEQKFPVRIKDKVVVKTWLDGSVHIFKKDCELNFKEITDKLTTEAA